MKHFCIFMLHFNGIKSVPETYNPSTNEKVSTFTHTLFGLNLYIFSCSFSN